jgi:hypothetical protein
VNNVLVYVIISNYYMDITMNERIRELAEEAGISLSQKDYSYYWVESAEDIEKFAELIVQECEVALSPMLRDMVSRGQAYDLIKKHFGVEE